MSDEYPYEREQAGIEYRVRVSPYERPQKVVESLIEQLRQYLEQVFSTYQVVYKIRIIVQPIMVKTPKPPITVSVVTKKPITEEEAGTEEEEQEEGG